MFWSTQPNRFYPYTQSGGYCHGICCLLREAISYSVYKNADPGLVFECIEHQLKTNANDNARGAQARRRWEGRKQASKYSAMNEKVIYVVGCNISIEPGYLTRYAISSYFNMSAWKTNHAVLFIGLSGSTIVCDPNWGCGLWNRLSIGSLSWSHLNSLIEGGYSTITPAYAVEIVY
jgi:hypothetical protein